MEHKCRDPALCAAGEAMSDPMIPRWLEERAKLRAELAAVREERDAALAAVRAVAKIALSALASPDASDKEGNDG